MADNIHTHSERETVREVPARSGRGSGFAFILGGVVVAVAVIAYFFFEGRDIGGAPAGSGGGDVSVTVTNEGGGAEGGVAPEGGSAEAGGESAAADGN